MTTSSFSEGLARARFRLDLFVRRSVLPLLVKRARLDQILKRIEPKGGQPYRLLNTSYILRRVKKASRRPYLMRDQPCLRQGLLAYHYLRKAGRDPELVFAVDPPTLHGADPKAHCWIELDGEDTFNPPESKMTVVLRHSASSRPASSRPAQ